MATIELENVRHSYDGGKTYALHEINLRWDDGVASALLGPSGCGKTTLLKIISGLIKPSEGRVLIDGKDVSALGPRERDVAQVFQFPVVYETLSVFDNLAFPLRNQGVDRHTVRQRVLEVAHIMELDKVLRKNAARLGPAEKQRISMGRGLVRTGVSAMLFDEPLTVIDPHQKWLLRRKLKEMHEQSGITMIYVTHDQHEALTFADQVTVMNMGKALQTDPPQALHNSPQAPFVGYFIGSPGMNLFDAQLTDGQITIGKGRSIISVAPEDQTHLHGKTLQLGIRPEFVVLGSEATPDAFSVSVDRATLTGAQLMAELSTPEFSYKAILPEDTQLTPGDTLWASFPRDKVMIYADEQAISLSSASQPSPAQETQP